MSTDPGSGDPTLQRARRRLQLWAQQHPQALPLARLAALAVRVDAPLLRRLRLRLLPRSEPGIEADVWLAPLHAASSASSVEFDTTVQAILRSELAALPAAPQRGTPLAAAWAITAGLHRAWPEALRIEEELVFTALQGGAGSAARIDALLQPALAAMASGGDARALEVARWAQRAVPRLPDTARHHPAALALWLAALLRLGLPAERLPDTGDAGLPPALQWLLPPGQVHALQRLALRPLADALRLQPLADGAPPAANEITLPRTSPLLLALRAEDTGGTLLLQRTLALDAAVAETRLPLPPGWQALDLASLAGVRWRLQRQVGDAGSDEAQLPWPQMRVQVLGPAGRSGPPGPVGMGCFVSVTEVVTVRDVLEPALLQALQNGELKVALQTVLLWAWNARGERQQLEARVTALDLRSSLVLLTLQRPFAGALVASRSSGLPTPGARAWTVPGPDGRHGRWDGDLHETRPQATLPDGRPTPDALSKHIALHLPQPLAALSGIAGAPVFVDRMLVGVADVAASGFPAGEGSTLWAVPAPAIDRFLAWARRPLEQAPQVLLHHAVDDPDGKGAELDERAVQHIEQATRRARLRLVQAAGEVGETGDDILLGTGQAPQPAAAVRLVTPVTRDDSSAAARMQLLGLAARRWARPDFGVLNLGHQRQEERARLPAPLAGLALQNLQKTGPEALARQLLDLVEQSDRPTLPPGPLVQATQQQLLQQLPAAARPFLPGGRALDAVREAALRQDLGAVAELVAGRWRSVSRLDAVPLVDLLAQLALPLRDDGLLDALRHAARGALALNAMPVQLGRLLIARAHAGHAPPPCVVVRDQDLGGKRTVDSIHGQVVEALAQALGCRPDQARRLLDRLQLAPWVLVTTRPLPSRDTLQALQAQLPSARLLFLAGAQPDLAGAAQAIGAVALPALPEGADMAWLAGYKRLMQLARPRPTPERKRRATTKLLKKT